MTMISGMAGMASLQPSILRAMAIDPEAGSTYLDAEHIILLMRENRSFDHALGALTAALPVKKIPGLPISVITRQNFSSSTM